MAHSQPSSKPKPEEKKEREDDKNTSPKESKQERCYTSPWARSRGGGIFLIIVLVVAYFIYKGVSNSSGDSTDNQPLGSTLGTAIVLPCGSDGMVNLAQLGIQNWKTQRVAYFTLSPGCTSAWILVPDEVMVFGSRYTFRVRPATPIEKRHYMPDGQASNWYSDNPGKRIATPLKSTARQWRNSGKSPVLITVEFIK